MFWDFLRRFIKGWFFPNRRGYSLRGFWGQIKHFNKYGVQIGYSVKSFWGGRKRYDMNGRLISYTVRNFWGGYNTYDANGVLIRKSYRNFWGGYNTYNRAGKKIMESYQSFWGGMNHFDVEDSHSTETYLFEKRSYTKPQRNAPTMSVTSQKPSEENCDSGKKYNTTNVKQETVSTSNTSAKIKRQEAVENSSSKTASISNGERTYGNWERPCQTTEPSTSVQNKKVDLGNLFQQQIDKTIPFYESVSEFCEKQDNCDDGMKILVFSYEGLKEFPAYVNGIGDKVSVSPLIKNIPAFTFEKNEIAEAQRKVMERLDMSVVDNEFASFCASKMIEEFDDLFPEYEYKNDGIARVQYELKCGLVITEKSWLKLKEKFD